MSEIVTCRLEGCEKAQPSTDDPLYPFCSEEHKEKWADQTYGKRGDKSVGGHTKEYMQKRLLEMAEEARLKAKKTLFD